MSLQDCEEAVENILNMDLRIQHYEEDLAELQLGVEQLLHEGGGTCEKDKDPAKTICIDEWIAERRFAGGWGIGDGRGPDSSATINQSRAQVYLDLDRGVGMVYVNHSAINLAFPGVFMPYEHHIAYPASAGQVKRAVIQKPHPDYAIVEYELWNSFCTGTPVGSTVGCLAITAHWEFKRGANGTWEFAGVQRTNYPSSAVYARGSDGVWHTRFVTAEGHWSHLRPQRQRIEGAKQQREQMRMPNGCNMQ